MLRPTISQSPFASTTLFVCTCKTHWYVTEEEEEEEEEEEGCCMSLHADLWLWIRWDWSYNGHHPDQWQMRWEGRDTFLKRKILMMWCDELLCLKLLTRRQDQLVFHVNYFNMFFYISDDHTHSPDSYSKTVWYKATVLVNPEILSKLKVWFYFLWRVYNYSFSLLKVPRYM